jgi:hypothetical protein
MQRQHETVETGQEDHSMALVPDEAGKLGSLAGDGAFPQWVECQNIANLGASRIYGITGITEFPNPSF